MKILWTDGSANPNPGPGGYAVIEKTSSGKFTPVCLGREEKSSNIRMEGAALYKAIEYAGEEGCEVHTDSEFWVNVLTKWAPSWKRNGWKKKSGPIKNLALVKVLFDIYQKNNVELVWVRGHEGNPGNEAADEYANKAREGLTVEEWQRSNK